MKTVRKGSVTVGALAIALLLAAEMAWAQAPRASDKARGYFGPAASPDPVDAIWLAPRGMLNGSGVATRQRAFSYNPAPSVAPMQRATRQVVPATPAPAARPAPAPATVTPPAVTPSAVTPSAAAPAATATARPRQYSYSYAPAPARADRVLGVNPAFRDASAKAQGEY